MKNTSRENSSIKSRVSEKVKSIDSFGPKFNFKLPDGSSNHKTWLGTLFAVLMLSTLIFYGAL